MQAAIMRAIDDVVDEAIENSMRADEDRASYGDSFNTNTYVNTRDKRAAFQSLAVAVAPTDVVICERAVTFTVSVDSADQRCARAC